MCVAIQKASPSFAKQQQALLDLATKFEPKVRNAFIRAVNAVQDEASLQALTDAAATGNYTFILAATGLEQFGVELAGMVDAINQNYQAAGALSATHAADGTAGLGIGVRFDPMNPRSASYASRYAYDLITNIQQQTREAIGEIIVSQTKTGINPRAAARQIKQVIGLNAPQAKALANYRTALLTGDWGKAASYSIGGNAERSINATAKLGTPMAADKVDTLVEGYRQRLLRKRSETIARTESMRATSNGAREAWQQVREGSNVHPSAFRRYWISTNDARTRDSHAEMPLVNAGGVGMDEPFKLPGGGTIMYPHDPEAPAKETINCRCTVVVRIEELDGAIPQFGSKPARIL